MRSWGYRKSQEGKRRRWARSIASRWVDPDSPKGKREVGKITRTHTFCGCVQCRWPKLNNIHSQMVRKQLDRMDDEARELD
ncbi:MAG: hypothetical protein IH944_13145 [Armatimonadetes bacterium]|nr:hypothetical protein [Armatimonadota bacterium]